MEKPTGKVQQPSSNQQQATIQLGQNTQKSQISQAPSLSIKKDEPKQIASLEEQEAVFSNICTYLSAKNLGFKVIEHAATRTSEESAIVRNTPLEWGAKTMLVNAIDNQLILLIYRANRKVSWKKIRKIPEIGKKAQMATEEEVVKLGVKPGGVPPFPNMIGVKGVLDEKFKQIQMMAFNAGHKCKSIVMKTGDFPLQDIKIGDITQD